MKIKRIMKKILIGTMLLAMGSSIGVYANESRSVDLKNVEIPLPEDIGISAGELDPTTIINMEEFLPDDSQITALNKIPSGEGKVIESESTGGAKTPEGKEFYVIQTHDEQVFYLVIDHAKSSDNVYFLDKIDANDLLADSKENSSSSEKNNNIKNILEEDMETEEATVEKEQTEQDENVKKREASKKSGNIFLFAIVIIGVLGAGYYVKIYKPKKQLLDDALDLENDFEGVENKEDEDDFYEEEEEEDEEEEEEKEWEEPAPIRKKQKSVVKVEMLEEDVPEEEEWEEPAPKQKKRKPVVQVEELEEEEEEEWEEPAPKQKKRKPVVQVEELVEEEEEEEWEEPVKKKKQKMIVQENRKPTNRKPTTTIKEQPKNSKWGTVFGMFGKIVFGSILVCLVSLGLTVLTNESLRNIIMETIKNYF